MAPSGFERDTDADWRELGASNPYWGVITHPDYEAQNITPARLDAFYASGAEAMADIVGRLERVTGKRPAGRALDFGCGAGRLTEAMAAYVDEAVGYDISPGMLAKARARGGKGRYVDVLPEGPFDWINSFIVFQHIPPTRGFALIQDLLDRLAPGGLVSLHVTVWREERLKPAQPNGWRRLVPGWARAGRLASLPPGIILMYDYDLSRLLEMLNRAGVEEMSLFSTDHDGHHGVIVFGQRTAR